jgi:hypothetical protein
MHVSSNTILLFLDSLGAVGELEKGRERAQRGKEVAGGRGWNQPLSSAGALAMDYDFQYGVNFNAGWCWGNTAANTKRLCNKNVKTTKMESKTSNII